MLEQYRLPGGQEHHSRSAGTDMVTLTLTLTLTAFREKSTEQRRNNTSSLGSRPDSFHHLRQTLPTQIEPTRGPMRGQPIAVRRCGPHEAPATQIVCELESYEIFLLSFQEDFYFQPPCFPGFLMAHPAIPDTRLHGSITPGSLQVFCAASAAVMFDAAQEKYPSLNSLPSATAYFDLVIISRNQSHNCLRRCSSNQTLCSHPELPTHLFPLTARLCQGGTRKILRCLL